MFQKQYGPTDKAHTLPESAVTTEDEPQVGVLASRTHPDGWAISGVLHTDGYYFWVNDFEATHPIHGRVWGNFEKVVQADSEAGLTAFCSAHPHEVWDYDDV